MIKESMGMLGLRARDKITGFTGVIDAVSFDLYGCIRICLRLGLGDKGELKHGHWFDIHRVETETERAMPVPDFEKTGNNPAHFKHGPAEKPARA